MAAKTLSCKLTSPELQKRKATVIAELRSIILERKELEDGFSYKFEGKDEILDKLTAFIKIERICCDFFKFQLTVGEKTAVLDITGPGGTKKFIKNELEF